MKITGTHVLHAGRQEVWEALQDPAVLVLTIPGCKELEEVGEDSWTATVTAGIASIQGTYEGRVSLHDREPPDSYRLHAQGSGGPGTIDATATITLEDGDDPDTTVASYDADAIVGGSIAGVGQRVLGGVARRNATAFFAAVDEHLRAGAASSPAPQPAGTSPEDGAVGSTPDAATRTFRAPATAGGSDPVHLAVAALLGAAVALAGVAVGRRTARG